MVGVIVLLIAVSPGIFTIYYKEVSLISVDGVSRLIREYGPLHIVYYIYIFAYLAAMLISVIYAIIKKKITSALQVTFLFAAVLCNIIIWFAEQLLPRGFELLSVSYVMTEIFILLLYAIMQEYGRLGHVETATGGGEPGGRYLLSERKRTRQDRTDRDGHFFDAEDIEKIVANCEADFALTARETDVLRCILANKKRKDIAAELFVTESTIKKYTSSIFKKMAVDNRISLLLEAQKYL